jgi:hypothetical protein
VTEAVVGGALVGVAQDPVGLVDFLELVLRDGVIRIAVRMILHGQLSVGLLEGRLASVAIYAQGVVIVLLGQKTL